jgi:hypothetical protein
MCGKLPFELKSIAAAIGLFAAFSNPTTALAGGWTADLTVTSVNTEASSDLIYWTVSPTVSYAAGCDATNWMMVLPSNSDRSSRFYSTLMTALATGKKVRLWYADTCNTWNYHGATSIKIVN